MGKINPSRSMAPSLGYRLGRGLEGFGQSLEGLGQMGLQYDQEKKKQKFANDAKDFWNNATSTSPLGQLGQDAATVSDLSGFDPQAYIDQASQNKQSLLPSALSKTPSAPMSLNEPTNLGQSATGPAPISTPSMGTMPALHSGLDGAPEMAGSALRASMAVNPPSQDFSAINPFFQQQMAARAMDQLKSQLPNTQYNNLVTGFSGLMKSAFDAEMPEVGMNIGLKLLDSLEKKQGIDASMGKMLLEKQLDDYLNQGKEARDFIRQRQLQKEKYGFMGGLLGQKMGMTGQPKLSDYQNEKNRIAQMFDPNERPPDDQLEQMAIQNVNAMFAKSQASKGGINQVEGVPGTPGATGATGTTTRIPGKIDKQTNDKLVQAMDAFKSTDAVYNAAQKSMLRGPGAGQVGNLLAPMGMIPESDAYFRTLGEMGVITKTRALVGSSRPGQMIWQKFRTVLHNPNQNQAQFKGAVSAMQYQVLNDMANTLHQSGRTLKSQLDKDPQFKDTVETWMNQNPDIQKVIQNDAIMARGGQ